jgi:hypothetical protein
MKAAGGKFMKSVHFHFPERILFELSLNVLCATTGCGGVGGMATPSATTDDFHNLESAISKVHDLNFLFALEKHFKTF